ncbi:MAG: hypothetical protein ACQEUM_06560 [Pseudomonadota bacterium]
MRDLEEKKGAAYASMALGVWTEIGIVLLPFLIYVGIGWWRNKTEAVLLSPELSMAAFILAAQGVLKLVRGLLISRANVEHVERAIFLCFFGFFISALALVAVILTIVVEPAPEAAAYLQPVLVLAAIAIFFATGGTGDWAVKRAEQSRGEANSESPDQNEKA